MELPQGGRARSGLLVTLALAVLLPTLAQLWQGDRDLNFSDEGYLWYGVQSTQAGAVPLRDFQSYHPGRYHWCAAFAALFGTGVIGVRAASAVFQGLGLLCALLVTRRFARGIGWQLVFGLGFMLWAFPRHKLFESGVACMCVWFAVRLLERPSVGRHLAAGVFVGLAGYFGSNLGLYAGLSLATLIALLAWKQPKPGRARRAGAWAAGVVLGFAPFLVMLVAVPGFARGFLDTVAMVREHGANISRPWPWPWRLETAALPARIAWRDWMESIAFLLPVVALPGLLFALWRARGRELGERAACYAPSVVGLFFLHHASVNSGAWHLAQCVQPVLLALLAVPELCAARRRLARGLVWSALALVSLGFTLAWNPLAEVAGERLVEREVAGETLNLLPGQAQYLAAVERAVRKSVGAETLFLAPNMPALYCVLGKTAPSWWLYFYFPMSEPEQLELIRSLAERGVGWALLGDPPAVAGREKSFRKTHPLVWEHFEKDWKRVAAPGLPSDLVLFRRKR